MIGIINKNEVFQLVDDKQFIDVLDDYDFNNSNIILIVDHSDTIKAIYSKDEGRFINGVRSFKEDIPYYLYGTVYKYGMTCPASVGDQLSTLNRHDWQAGPIDFIYKSIYKPTRIPLD